MKNIRNILRHIVSGFKLDEADVNAMHATDLDNIRAQDFIRDLSNLYEIEYKLHVVNNANFTGHVKRYERIAQIYKRKAVEHVRVVATVFRDVFKEWLEFHAISDPELWAYKRAESNVDDGETTVNDLFAGSVSEYNQRLNTGRVLNPRPEFTLIDILHNMRLKGVYPDGMPRMKAGLERLAMDAAEDFRLNILNDEEANQSVEDIDTTSIPSFEDDPERWYEELLEMYDADTISDQFFTTDTQTLAELYRVAVFPLWWKIFEPRGIVRTRARVEEAYKELIDLSKINEFTPMALARLNIIKDVAHQSGSMMDYIQEWADKNNVGREYDPDADYDEAFENSVDVQATFDMLTSIGDAAIEVWNNEMREIGFEPGVKDYNFAKELAVSKEDF